MSDNKVCELVCTRLSHDIIGNIGAVANAVELLEEGDMDFIDDIKSILKTSSTNMAARLKFFRMAFGLENPNLEDEKIVKDIAQNYLLTLGNKDFPIRLSFEIGSVSLRKSALLAVMIMADIMLRGGILDVAEQNGKVVAQISVDTKISEDKLGKIADAIASEANISDAVLAPVSMLLAMWGKDKILVGKDSDYIRLIVG